MHAIATIRRACTIHESPAPPGSVGVEGHGRATMLPFAPRVGEVPQGRGACLGRFGWGRVQAPRPRRWRWA